MHADINFIPPVSFLEETDLEIQSDLKWDKAMIIEDNNYRVKGKVKEVTLKGYAYPEEMDCNHFNAIYIETKDTIIHGHYGIPLKKIKLQHPEDACQKSGFLITAPRKVIMNADEISIHLVDKYRLHQKELVQLDKK